MIQAVTGHRALFRPKGTVDPYVSVHACGSVVLGHTVVDVSDKGLPGTCKYTAGVSPVVPAVGIMAVDAHFCGCRTSHGHMANGRAHLHVVTWQWGHVSDQAIDVQVDNWKS